MILRILIAITVTAYLLTPINAQPDRWQQHVDYQMVIDFDVNSHRFIGEQTILYTNHSPDTLDKVFYHLYFNAFQPGSMMDERSRTIRDPDSRVGSRIAYLSPDEIGYHKIDRLTVNEKPVSYEVVGTILEVSLDEPILPGQTAELKMQFNSQVPIQIRRSGRDNREGIDYSMAQWYPKLAEYDYQGWHSNPYIGREFYGVWGDYDVTIKIDKDYIIGGTGILLNAEDIGYGYTREKGMSSSANPIDGKLEWHFKGENIHDFVWAADPDYTHTKAMSRSGTVLHFFYQENDRTKESWQRLPQAMVVALEFMNQKFGKYPYPVYSFIQGGDGGMEYPMATLITGERSFGSLVGVSIHEWMHSWYHMVLGTNESLYAWMDEGFTSYGTSETKNYLRKMKILNGKPVENPHINTLNELMTFNSTGMEEPLSIHSDHFRTNRAYGVAAYTKGQVFLKQLEGIIGENAFDRALLRYFETWKFKHPNPNDFIRIFEKESGIELDWYKEYMVYTTKTADYAIDTVQQLAGETIIKLRRVGEFPMPIDVTLVKQNGEEVVFNIPLRMMRGDKSQNTSNTLIVVPDWPWVFKGYDLKVDLPIGQIQSVHIDKNNSFADADRFNNYFIMR